MAFHRDGRFAKWCPWGAPGMPMGSPGMEVDGMAADPFSVFSIAGNGAMIEFDFYGSK